MDRPALQKLLEAVKARKVDVIVVYKVDRLTRSLANFAKRNGLMKAHQVISATIGNRRKLKTGSSALSRVLILGSSRVANGPDGRHWATKSRHRSSPPPPRRPSASRRSPMHRRRQISEQRLSQ
jgi:hypothetical protein